MPVVIFVLIFIITTIVEYIGHFILDEFYYYGKKEKFYEIAKR